MRFYFRHKTDASSPLLAVSAFSSTVAWGHLLDQADAYTMAGASEGDRMLWGDPALLAQDRAGGSLETA
jgi:hypothetical protein